MEPPNKVHYGANDFVPCREVVPILESMGLKQVPFVERSRGSLIRGSTVYRAFGFKWGKNTLAMPSEHTKTACWLLSGSRYAQPDHMLLSQTFSTHNRTKTTCWLLSASKPDHTLLSQTFSTHNCTNVTCAGSFLALSMLYQTIRYLAKHFPPTTAPKWLVLAPFWL